MPRWPKRTPRPGVDEYGRTPLWNFAFAGDTPGMKHQLDAGADPNTGDDAGFTPLQIAIQEKHLEAVELLLRSGADPNLADKHGNSPLWTAVNNWEHNDQIILLLLRAGANAHLANNFGNSPFEVLAHCGKQVAKLLANREKPK